MAIEINTKVSVGETFGKNRLGNLTLEDAKFWGRPNFSGEMDRFKDDRRKFTVLIPNDVADQLRELGWNVKTVLPDADRLAQDPDAQPISSLKVMVDFSFDEKHPGDVDYEKGSSIWVIMGDDREKLTSKTAGLLDRSRIEEMSMEIRAWMYNQEEVTAGVEEPKYSARLEQLVAVLRPNILEQKYGRLS